MAARERPPAIFSPPCSHPLLIPKPHHRIFLFGMSLPPTGARLRPPRRALPTAASRCYRQPPVPLWLPSPPWSLISSLIPTIKLFPVRNRRWCRWLNDSMLLELVPQLGADKIKGLFAPPPWGEEPPLSAFCMTTTAAAWDVFRTIDIDVRRFRRRLGEDETIDRQTREAIKSNFLPHLLGTYEARVMAFIQDTSDDKYFLALEVQDPFQRMLLHGVCEVFLGDLGIDDRHGLLIANSRGERSDRQVRDLGHDRAGVVPQPRAHVLLPWRRHACRLRHHQCGEKLGPTLLPYLSSLSHNHSKEKWLWLKENMETLTSRKVKEESYGNYPTPDANGAAWTVHQGGRGIFRGELRRCNAAGLNPQPKAGHRQLCRLQLGEDEQADKELRLGELAVGIHWIQFTEDLIRLAE